MESNGNTKVTVNLEIFRDWYKTHAPLAKEKLAIKSGISVATQERMLCKKTAPKPSARWQLAMAIGVSEEKLFPIKKKTA